MKKTIVVYYSNKGSNKFLAESIAERLSCKIEKLKPILNLQLLLIMGIGFGNKKIRNNISDYERVILCGPIWMGKFIYPLKNFVKQQRDNIQELIFVTCCGSSDEMKNEKFGHGLVFEKVRQLLKEKNTQCIAFPVTLMLTDDKKEDPKTVMETRLRRENFKGEIQQRFEKFIDSIK